MVVCFWSNDVVVMDFDLDYIVIGSGFGGSVSAMRLAEKGYSVLVLEKGAGSRLGISLKLTGICENFYGCPR